MPIKNGEPLPVWILPMWFGNKENAKAKFDESVWIVPMWFGKNLSIKKIKNKKGGIAMDRFDINQDIDPIQEDVIDIDISSPEGIKLLQELVDGADILPKRDKQTESVMMPSVMIDKNGEISRHIGEPFHRQQGADWVSVSIHRR